MFFSYDYYAIISYCPLAAAPANLLAFANLRAVTTEVIFFIAYDVNLKSTKANSADITVRKNGFDVIFDKLNFSSADILGPPSTNV